MDFRKIAKVFLYTVLASSCASVWGPSTAEAQEIFRYYRGVRELGMGGAYVATVNDETAVLTNPAGLGKLRDYYVTVVDPELSGSIENTRVATLSNFTQVFDTQGLLDSLKNNKGVHWHAKGQLFPSIVGPNFGVGLLVKYSEDAEVNAAGTNFRLDYTNDWGANLGYCFRFFGGILKLGLAGRLVNRTEVAKDIDPNSTGLSISGLSSEGVGLGADAGLILTAPVAWLPTLASAVRDIGTTTYDVREGIFNATVGRPRPTQQKVDVALAVFPIVSNRVRMSIAAELHDVTRLSEEAEKMRLVHIGAELNAADFLFVRAGMNQRYWTAGVELASQMFQLQAATYGEDIGTSTSSREDRRWVGKFAVRF